MSVFPQYIGNIWLLVVLVRFFVHMSLVWDCPPYTEFVQSGLQILSSANFAFFFWRILQQNVSKFQWSFLCDKLSIFIKVKLLFWCDKGISGPERLTLSESVPLAKLLLCIRVTLRPCTRPPGCTLYHKDNCVDLQLFFKGKLGVMRVVTSQGGLARPSSF